MSETQPSAQSSSYGYGRALEFVSDFWRERFERENGKNWDKYYRAANTGFIASTKNREYLGTDLASDLSDGARVVLEIGCGCGHSIAPLAKAFPSLRFFAIDVSARAIELLRANEDVPTRDGRCEAFVCDVQREEKLPDRINQVDCSLLIFVLSSIAPQWHAPILRKIRAVMAPGGTVMFRDYAQGDACQVEFDAQYPPRKLSKDFYVRPDGTRAFFFSVGAVESMFAEAGFEKVDISVIRINRHVNDRLFIKAKFRVGSN